MTRSTAKRLAAFVGANVRRKRIASNMSTAELGAAADIGQRYLRYIESGTRSLNLELLVRLANALDCEPWELLLPAEAPRRKAGRPRVHFR